MAEPKEKRDVKVPVFENRTKIDQVVYDESFSPVLVHPRGAIRGEHYSMYAGKEGPLRLIVKSEETVEIPEIETVRSPSNTKHEKGVKRGKVEKRIDVEGTK